MVTKGYLEHECLNELEKEQGTMPEWLTGAPAIMHSGYGICRVCSNHTGVDLFAISAS
jgi:hypothetical protein